MNTETHLPFVRAAAFVATLMVGSACSSSPGQDGAPSSPSPAPPANGEVGAASSAVAPATKGFEEWRQLMARTPLPTEGCFRATHPSTTWEKVTCSKGLQHPFIPAKRGTRPTTVGNGSNGDFAAQVSGTMSWAEGAFPSVSGVTYATTAFSLQLNSQAQENVGFCNTPQDPTDCQEWQQFVYSEGDLFMQYWLVNYGKTCPSGWMAYGDDCYKNSSVISVPTPALSSLASLVLTGAAGTTDTVTMSDGTGTLYTVSQASALDLNQWWSAAEFNVFGPGGGSEVTFNAGSTVMVRTSVEGSSAPTCLQESFTGETNSLNLESGSAPLCCALDGISPAIQFWESNVAGATPPACPPSTCSPKTCSFEAGMCGVQSDGCGGTISCGGCGTDQTCESGMCVVTSCASVKTCPVTELWKGPPTCACEPRVINVCPCGGVSPHCRICI